MSKRYGRNQKRAHRALIKDLAERVAKGDRDNVSLFEHSKALQREIDCAKRIVGEYCIAFQPRSVTMSFRDADYVTVMNHEREFNSGVSRYWDFSQNPMLQPMRIEQVRLPVMCVLASEDLRMTRHVVAKYDGKAYGYAIDSIAWHTARYPEALCRNIADRLTQHIYEEMQKTKPRVEPRKHTRDQYVPEISSPRFEFPGLPDFLR